MEQTYTAIETLGGFLAFTDTAEGRRKLRQFLQQTADAYFKPAFNSGALSVYRAEGELGNRPWVNPGRMWSDEYPYGPKPHGDQMELLYRGEMRPTAEDFRSFCHNAGCEISARNVNITDTLDALERYDRRKYSINSLVYWVTYVHNVVYSFYRSMIYCYINSTQRCAGSIVIDIIPTNGADKRKFFPFAPYFPVTNVIKRYFYPYFPAIIGIKGYSFPYFPYLSGIMKIKTALYSLFSRLDWHKTVVFPCLGEIYEGIRSLSWEIPVT